MRSSITSANCASMARSRARRDRCGIVGPSMMASRTREAAGWRVSASSSCGASDSILRGHNQSWRTPGLLLHCAHLSSTSALCGALSRKRDCRSSAPVVVGSRGLDATLSRDFLGGVSGNPSCDSRLDDAAAFALLAITYSCKRRQMY